MSSDNKPLISEEIRVNLEEAKLKLSKYCQEQILRYYDELSDDEKAALLNRSISTDMEVFIGN